MATISKKKSQMFLVWAVVLISIQFWSFSLIPAGLFDFLDILVVLTFLMIVIDTKIRRPVVFDGVFKRNMYWFLLLPFVSTIGSYLYRDQGFFASFFTLRTNLYWLFYFVLHIYDIPVKKLLSLLVTVGAVWAFLNIIQQFTYPHYWFFTRDDADAQIYRAGVYRFMPLRHQYGVFLVIYYFNGFLASNKNKYLWYTLFALIGVYFFGTRQFLAISVIAIALMLLTQNRGKVALVICMFLISGGVLFYFQDVLLGKFIKITQDDIRDDNIRLISFNFYMNEYWPKEWFAKVIGNGKNSHSGGQYAADIDYYEGVLKMFRTDVGIIGTYSKYGLLYVAAVVAFLLKGIKKKYFSDSNRYMKMIFISQMFIILLNVQFDYSSAIPFYVIIIYIIEKDYKESLRLKAQARRNEEEERDRYEQDLLQPKLAQIA